MVLPGLLVRFFLVVLAYPLLYPCEKLSEVAFNGVPDEEWDALDERRKRENAGASLPAD